MKKRRSEAEEPTEYLGKIKNNKKQVYKALEKAMEDWIGTQCEETGTCLNKIGVTKLRSFYLLILSVLIHHPSCSNSPCTWTYDRV